MLQKRNNAPSTLTVTVEDAKDKTKMSYSNTVAYAYSGDKCYVAEASAKNSEIRDSATKKPVDMVVYNKEMCDQVLSLSNKLSDNDLQKCGSVFDSVQAVSKQFEAKLAAEGRKMSVGEMGMVATYSQKWEPSAIDVISNCKGNRFFYPVSGIPASNATYPMGGGIVGAGGIGSSSSKGSSEPAH